MTNRQDLIERIGKLNPAQDSVEPTPYRALLLLWAIAQAVQGRPRLQSWSELRDAAEPVMTTFAGSMVEHQDVLCAFWELQSDALWEVTNAVDLPRTGRRKLPRISALDEANPQAGLPEQDYLRLTTDLTLASWAVSTLLVRFFATRSAELVEELGLQKLTAGGISSGLRPLVGETYVQRRDIGITYGCNRVMGITPLADGILTVYSDDKGPYSDQRIPETQWIAYTGEGLSGDQKMDGGNKNLAGYQKKQKALRYWHKPHKGQWAFETWAVVVQCR